MKVAVYHSNSDIKIEEHPVPEIKDGEILVRMKSSGICGTDVMEWYRKKKAPCVLGHEMAGVIADAESGVGHFKKGDRVFVSHHVPCHSCEYCRQGKYTACEALHTGNYFPGGFAEYIKVPAENVKYGTFYLPDAVSFDEGAMIEPLGCAIAGQKRLGIREGQTVFVIGSGISGILHIQLAKMRKARVIASDINTYRLGKAVEFGADAVINAAGDSSGQLREVNNNRPADVVIVCAAAQKAAVDAFASVDRRGEILFFAAPRDDIPIPSMNLWRNEIAMMFSYGASPDDIKEAIHLTENGYVNVAGMVTHRVPLAAIMDGFRITAEANESLKVVVVPDGDIQES